MDLMFLYNFEVLAIHLGFRFLLFKCKLGFRVLNMTAKYCEFKHSVRLVQFECTYNKGTQCAKNTEAKSLLFFKGKQIKQHFCKWI